MSGLPVHVVVLITCLAGMARAQTTRPPAEAPLREILRFRDAQGQERPVRTAEDWQHRRGQILRAMQEVMGPLPVQWRKTPLEMEVLESAELKGYVRKKIRYRVEPADRVCAYLLIPKRLTGRAAAVVCLHQTIEAGKESPVGLADRPDLHYAHELAERGIVTLAPDYWTFGDYRQSKYDPYEHGYQSGTMKGIWNHVRSVDLLESLPEVDPQRIGAIGHSLGGHNALWLAAFDERIKGVVSSCGFNSLRSYAASPYGQGDLRNWAQRRYMPRIASVYGNDPRRMPFEWHEVLAAIAPRAVFINAPAGDENFVIEGVRESLEGARPAYRLLGAEDRLVSVHPQAGHAFPEEIRRQAYGFLERALAGARSK